MMPLRSKRSRPKLEHRNKEDQLQSSCPLKLEGVELSYLVYSIILWISSKFVRIIPWGSKLGPVDRKLEHKNKRPTSKFFLSETGKSRALIFGVLYLLVDLY